MNNISNFFWISLRTICLYLIFITPYQLYLLDIRTDIFPSLDLIIIFLLSMKYTRLGYMKLFLLGIFIDYLNGLERCIYPIILILSELALRYVRSYIYLNCVFELTLFIYYISVVNIIKYLVLCVLKLDNIHLTAAFMQYVTTILVYPLIHILVSKVMKLAK